MEDKIFTTLYKRIKDGRVLRDEPLSGYTSFRTGGPADCLVIPADANELAISLKLASQEQIPFCIIGNGSNMLVADEGFRGMVILSRQIKTEFCSGSDPVFTEDGDMTIVTAAAGCSLTKVAVESARRGLAGLEFAAGIPGSLGGAVVMNAGAYGGEIKDYLTSVDVMDTTGCVRRVSADELELSYRHSNISECGLIVLDANFRLRQGDRNAILEQISELNSRRREKQPLEYPSAGSTFKRPEGYYAGKLIEDAGFKGYSVGGAAVSEKHCGFVINKDKASSADIMQVITDVRKGVFEMSGVMLEPEVRFLGFSDISDSACSSCL